MFPWINEFFDPNTPVVLVNQPREDGNSRVDNLPFPNWIVTMPFLRGGRGSMHVKVSKFCKLCMECKAHLINYIFRSSLW